MDMPLHNVTWVTGPTAAKQTTGGSHLQIWSEETKLVFKCIALGALNDFKITWELLCASKYYLRFCRSGDGGKKLIKNTMNTTSKKTPTQIP